MVEHAAELSDFIKESLSQRNYYPGGQKISALEKWGDRYESYLMAVTAYAEYFNLKPSEYNRFYIKGLDIHARVLGFTNIQIGSMKVSGRKHFERWLELKVKTTEEQRRVGFNFRSGTDPHEYLGDSSHPQGLGYDQSSREE